MAASGSVSQVEAIKLPNAPTPPRRAMGGLVQAGLPYIVGERGSELFVPQQTGTIVPNDKLGGMGITINVTGNSILNDNMATRLVDLMMDRLKFELRI